jgi:hypothetical protein
VTERTHPEHDLAAAKEAAARLQDAAAEGTPIPIPGSLSNIGVTPNPSLALPEAPNPSAPPADAPLADLDPEEAKLDGGGKQ